VRVDPSVGHELLEEWGSRATVGAVIDILRRAPVGEAGHRAAGGEFLVCR